MTGTFAADRSRLPEPRADPPLLEWLMGRDDATSLRRWLLLGPTLVLLTVTGVTARSGDHTAVLVAGALALLMVRVVWWLTSYFEPWSPLNLVFYLASLAGIYGLVLVDSTFGYYAVVGFIDATLLCGRRRTALVLIVLTGMTVAYAEVYDTAEWDWTTVAWFALFLAANTLVAWAIRAFLTFARTQVLAREAANTQLQAKIDQMERLHRQVVDQAWDAAQRSERLRMARELHDTVAQGLAGIVTQLEAAEHDRDWIRRGGMARELARTSLPDVRRVIEDLHGSDEVELSGALHRLVSSWGRLNDIEAEVVVVGEPEPVPFAGELVRICHECLTNVANHARARKVLIHVKSAEATIELLVEDDGVGFMPTSIPPGHGIRGINERVARFGGSVNIDSAPGRGCRVLVAMPLAAPKAAVSSPRGGWEA